MKKFFKGFMLCTMLLCISAVSFGSDGAKTIKEPDKVSMEDLSYSADVISVEIVSLVIADTDYGLDSLSTSFKAVAVPFYKTLVAIDAITPLNFIMDPGLCYAIVSNTGTLETGKNYITIPKQMTASNHVGKLSTIGNVTYTGNFI